MLRHSNYYNSKNSKRYILFWTSCRLVWTARPESCLRHARSKKVWLTHRTSFILNSHCRFVVRVDGMHANESRKYNWRKIIFDNRIFVVISRENLHLVTKKWNMTLRKEIYGVCNKSEPALYFVKRFKVQSFSINTDCVGTYNIQ